MTFFPQLANQHVIFGSFSIFGAFSVPAENHLMLNLKHGLKMHPRGLCGLYSAVKRFLCPSCFFINVLHIRPSTTRVNYSHMRLIFTLGDKLLSNISQWLINSQILLASV